MEPISPENQKPPKYSLTKKDFKNHPLQIEPYEFPQRVTRDNFVNWLMQSFTHSRGDVDSQVLWMKYIGLKTGFDSYTSLLAFEGVGGLTGAISHEEGVQFKDAFTRVKAHKNEGVTIEKSFDESFEVILIDLSDPSHKNHAISAIPDWKNLDPRTFLERPHKFTGSSWGMKTS